MDGKHSYPSSFLPLSPWTVISNEIDALVRMPSPHGLERLRVLVSAAQGSTPSGPPIPFLSSLGSMPPAATPAPYVLPMPGSLALPAPVPFAAAGPAQPEGFPQLGGAAPYYCPQPRTYDRVRTETILEMIPIFGG